MPPNVDQCTLCDSLALRAHFWLKFNLSLVVTPIWATTQPLGTQPVPTYKVIPSQIQNSALLFIEFDKVSVNPNFKFLKDFLECSFTIRYVGYCQLVSFTDLRRVYFVSSSRSLVKTLKNAGPSIHPWSTPLATYWLPTRYKATELSVQPIFNPSGSPFVQTYFLGFQTVTLWAFVSQALLKLNIFRSFNVTWKYQKKIHVWSWTLLFWYCNATVKCLKTPVRIWA